MNFEVIDNIFQVLMLLTAAGLSAFSALKNGSRRYVLLAGGYGCFAMGTFYYVLYLVIRGNVPQVFYVAEVAWMSAYLFLLALELMRIGERVPFSLPSAAVCVAVIAVELCFDIPGYSWLMGICFGAETGMLSYLAVWRIVSHRKREHVWMDIQLLLIVFLQIAVYAVSVFTSDYTRFNAYFAVDIMLTLSWVCLYFLMRREAGSR